MDNFMHSINNLSFPPIEPIEIEPMEIRDYRLADRKYEILKEQIEEFQEGLSTDVDVCVQLASFGTSVLMYVSDIGYQNPDILYFYGIVNGQEAQLIQHMSQLNFLLMAVKKEHPEDEPKRIGFIVDED